MNNFSAQFNKEMMNDLFSAFFREMNLLTAQQIIDLRTLEVSEDGVFVEADVLEDTVQ